MAELRPMGIYYLTFVLASAPPGTPADVNRGTETVATDDGCGTRHCTASARARAVHWPRDFAPGIT